MNYYEHHLGDYLRDTAHLTMLEDGAYRRLLDAYYIREAPLPKEFREIFRLVRASSKSEREAVETVLREFFEETADGWRHKRCDEEVERFKAKRDKARRSAEARWKTTATASNGDANASDDTMRTHTGNDANASTGNMRTQCEGNAPRARSSHQTPDTSNNSLSGRDDRLDIPGLTGYHPEDWQPDLAKLAALLQRAGIPMPSPESLSNSLTRFNLNFHGKPLTESETYSRLVTWLTGDYRREQTQQQRTQAGGGTSASRRPQGFENGDAVGDAWLREQGVAVEPDRH